MIIPVVVLEPTEGEKHWAKRRSRHKVYMQVFERSNNYFAFIRELYQISSKWRSERRNLPNYCFSAWCTYSCFNVKSLYPGVASCSGLPGTDLGLVGCGTSSAKARQISVSGHPAVSFILLLRGLKEITCVKEHRARLGT